MFRPEKNVSIMLGYIELLIWLALALPSDIYVFQKILGKGKAYLLIPIILYIALAVIYIILTHGGFILSDNYNTPKHFEMLRGKTSIWVSVFYAPIFIL